MRVIAIANEKGGTGKTTIAAHLGAGLAQHGRSTVLIDTDPQGHLATLFGMPKEDGLYNLVADYQDWPDVLRQVPADRYADPTKNAGELWLLPDHKETSNIPLVQHVNDNVLVLHERLQELEQIGVEYVIIDTAPTASLVDSLVYIAVDLFLFVTIPEKMAYDGIRESREKLARFRDVRLGFGLDDYRILGILPNMARPNTTAHREKLAELASLYPGEVWASVKQRIGWTHASNDEKLVFAHAPKSGVAADAWELVERFEEALAR